MRRLAFILCLLCLSVPAYAVEPSEILPDANLENRAREISSILRCLVCQNESIDESSASLARDLRLLVRERLVLGETDQQVIDFVVSRYGEFVLLQPKINGINIVLWAIGPLALVFSIMLSASYIRTKNRTKKSKPKIPLSANEQARLDEILNQ